MKRRVLVAAAEKFELASIRAAVAGRDDTSFVLVAQGPGKKLVEEAMSSAGPFAGFDAVVSAGICGALVDELTIGSIVVATTVNGVSVSFPGFLSGSGSGARSGPVVSVDYVAGTFEDKKRLRASGAIAVEMEAAAVVRTASMHGKPCYCIKAVSDTAGETFALDLNSARDASGRFSVPKILWQAARAPWAMVPELGRLRRNSRTAADALGDFFAHCSF